MKKYLKPVWLVLLLMSYLVSCSNAPDQPANFADSPPDPPVITKGLQPAGPDPVQFVSEFEEDDNGYLGEEGSADVDAIVKLNSEKPIIYGEGAAGVSLDTTFPESKKLLTKPLRGPYTDGTAIYNERVQIVWRTEGNETPFFILALPGYKGSISIVKEVGGITQPMALTDDLSFYMGSNPRAGADNLAKDMYQAMTGVDTDCVKENICTISWGDSDQMFFLIQFPGIIVRFSKDRFVLFIALVQKTIPQGPLGNDFDLFNTQFLSGLTPISLGDSFASVNGKLLDFEPSLSEVEIAVNRNNFGRNYTGIYLIYEKTDFSRESVRPQESDRLIGVQLYDQYKNNILIDGKPLYIIERVDSVALSAELPTGLLDARVTTLQTKVNLLPSNIKSFSRQLVAYLKKSALEKYPMATGQLFGAHQLKTIKEYDGQVIAYDPQSEKGLYLSFEASEETGNINNFFAMITGKSIQAYDPIVIPMSAEDRPLAKVSVDVPVANGMGVMIGGTTSQKLPYYTELSGIRLNDLILVSDKDIFARNEATIQFVKPYSVNSFIPDVVQANVNATERAYYDDEGVVYLPGPNGDTLPRKQHVTTVSNFGISLGVASVLETQDGKSYMRVISITSGFVNGEVHDLCSLTTFKPKFSMDSTVFLKSLQSALVAEGKSCNYFFTKDSDSNQRLASIYFPDDRIRLNFDDNELSQAMIYLPMNEVRPMPTQGGN